MTVTPASIRVLYPWMFNLPDISDPGYAAALAESDLILNILIDRYSGQLDPDAYGDNFDHALYTLIAHDRFLADKNCIQMATALKQLESGKNLSLDNVFDQGCNCSNDAWLHMSKYGDEFLYIRDDVAGGGFTMGVVCC